MRKDLLPLFIFLKQWCENNIFCTTMMSLLSCIFTKMQTIKLGKKKWTSLRIVLLIYCHKWRFYMLKVISCFFWFLSLRFYMCLHVCHIIYYWGAACYPHFSLPLHSSTASPLSFSFCCSRQNFLYRYVRELYHVPASFWGSVVTSYQGILRKEMFLSLLLLLLLIIISPLCKLGVLPWNAVWQKHWCSKKGSLPVEQLLELHNSKQMLSKKHYWSCNNSEASNLTAYWGSVYSQEKKHAWCVCVCVGEKEVEQGCILIPGFAWM